MKRIAVLLVCSGFWAMQGTPLEERLVQAVRQSDAPRVSYLLGRLGRESLTASARKSLVGSLVDLSRKVLEDEKKRSSLGSNDGRADKLIGGTVCGLAGLFVSAYGLTRLGVMRKYNGFLKIYDDWKNVRNQDIRNYYWSITGGIVAMTGLRLMYDGLQGSSKARVSQAREVRDSLIAQSEELGS